jgi:hypothetical protein
MSLSGATTRHFSPRERCMGSIRVGRRAQANRGIGFPSLPLRKTAAILSEMATVLPNTDMTRVTSATKLSELQRMQRERKVSGGRRRIVRSIQQSMRVEGYDVSEQVIDAAVGPLLGLRSQR